MGVNYYEVLNVTKNFSDDDLKEVYGNLAIRCHPDEDLNNRTEAEAKFKQIAEAYEVLSDQQKRAVYDQCGEEGLKGGPSAFIPRNALEILESFGTSLDVYHQATQTLVALIISPRVTMIRL